MATTAYALDVAGRFWPRVDQSGECWIWTGYRNQKGYGVMAVANQKHPAHRVSWELSGRILDPNLTIDHLCRNRACVNPDHLEQVSVRENVLRGDTLPAANLLKVSCPKGHPLDGQRRNGDRFCRTCKTAAWRRYQPTRRRVL